MSETQESTVSETEQDCLRSEATLMGIKAAVIVIAPILLGFFIGYNLSKFANGLEISIDAMFLAGAIGSLVSAFFAFIFLAEVLSVRIEK